MYRTCIQLSIKTLIISYKKEVWWGVGMYDLLFEMKCYRWGWGAGGKIHHWNITGSIFVLHPFLMLMLYISWSLALYSSIFKNREKLNLEEKKSSLLADNFFLLCSFQSSGLSVFSVSYAKLNTRLYPFHWLVFLFLLWSCLSFMLTLIFSFIKGAWNTWGAALTGSIYWACFPTTCLSEHRQKCF